MNKEKWNTYAEERMIEKNRLTMRHHQETISFYISFFSKMNKNKKILDLACGGGFFLEILRNLGFVHIQGIDLAKPFVKRAKSKNLNVSQGDISKIDFYEEYDCITCMEIFEHLENPPLKQIRQALKPGGYLYVTVPVYDSLKHKCERLFKGITKMEQAKRHDPTHINTYSKDILKKQITSADFKTISCTHCYNPVLPYFSFEIPTNIINLGMFCVGIFKKPLN